MGMWLELEGPYRSQGSLSNPFLGLGLIAGYPTSSRSSPPWLGRILQSKMTGAKQIPEDGQRKCSIARTSADKGTKL